MSDQASRVFSNDLDADPAQAVIEEIKGFGGEAVTCTGDVTTPDFGNRFVKTALDSFGGLDIIVNNAGYTWDSVIQKRRLSGARWASRRRLFLWTYS